MMALTPLRPPEPLSAELALAVACAMWPPSDVRRAAVAAAADRGVDWASFLAVVRRHRIGGFAQQGLDDAGITLPQPFGAVLHRLAQDIMLREMRCASEVIRVQRLLDAAEVPVRVLKGVTIACAAIGRLGVRYNHDVDLLVARHDVSTTCKILESLGYVRTEPAGTISEATLRSWLRMHKDMAYRHPATSCVVEIHWRLFDNPRLLRSVALMAEPKLIPLGPDEEVKTLPDDLGFAYLVLHGVEHAWSRLKWLADLGAILSACDETGVAHLYEKSEALGAGRSAALGIALSAELFGTPLPAIVKVRIDKDWRLRSLRSVAYHSFSGEGDRVELEARPFATTVKNLSHYLVAGGFRYWCWELFYDISDVSGARSPKNLGMMGPVLRPLTWLWGQIALLAGPRLGKS